MLVMKNCNCSGQIGCNIIVLILSPSSSGSLKIDEKTNQHFSCKILLFVFLWRMYAVLQCKWMCTFYTFNHTSSLPQRALVFLLFYNLYEVTDLKHETEEDEAIIVQPNPWLPMLNWARKRHMRSRGCSVTS